MLLSQFLPEISRFLHCIAGMSSPGVLGMPWLPQILADQLTLAQPGGTDYAHQITSGTPGFSDLPTTLQSIELICKYLAKVCFNLHHGLLLNSLNNKLLVKKNTFANFLHFLVLLKWQIWNIMKSVGEN